MKKYLALFLGMLFVLGFAATSFAIHAEIPSETQAVVAKGATQITLGGEIRVRGEFRQNIADFNSDAVDRSSFWDQRVRLSIEAKVSPNTIGFIQLESTNEDQGSTSQDNNVWGNYNYPFPNGAATGMYRVGNAKHNSLSILQAWIQHSGSGLLGVPALVKVGHMPIKLGYGLFLDHSKFGDDALLLGVDPMKNMHLIGATIKFKEGVVTSVGSSSTAATIQNDDANAYALIFAYDFDKMSSMSLDATYVDHQKLAGAAPLWIDAHLWNFGLRGNTNVAGLGIKADVEIQAGTLENGTSQDFRGWAVMGGLSYKLAPVTLSVDAAYGSGDNGSDPKKIKSFFTTLGADQHFTYVYEYRTKNAANQAYGGLTNTWYVKLGGNADLTKDINADLGLYFLQAVKKENVNTVYGFAHPTDSKNIGTEIDARVIYKIDRNLQYWVEGGYLFAGNFWKAVVPVGKSPDDAYAIRHGIMLSF